MLISFKVSNFLSFENEQEFSLIAGGTQKKADHIIDRDLKLLKFSSIFGSNASGKSNLIKAIALSRSVVLNGIVSNLSKKYCRISEKNKDKVSSFEYQIEINHRFYSYGFDILLSKNSIRGEWLIELDKKNKKEILVFSRNNESIEINENYFSNNTDITSRLKVYFEDMKNNDNILFLTLMNRNKNALYESNNKNNIVFLKYIFNWFCFSLVVITPTLSLDNTNSFISDKKLEEINEIMTTFDTGIKECSVKNVDPLELQNRVPPFLLKSMSATLEDTYRVTANSNQQIFLRLDQEMFVIKESKDKQPTFKKIVLKHESDYDIFDFNEESDGTKRLFDLVEILLNNKSEKVFIIDELDRCLHPNLTIEFVKRFLESNPNSQLIVTTHESRLLDLNLIRRDEAWFTNREKDGSTKLYSLEEYKTRFDKKIDKAYLDGRYGGVPFFSQIVIR